VIQEPSCSCPHPTRSLDPELARRHRREPQRAATRNPGLLPHRRCSPRRRHNAGTVGSHRVDTQGMPTSSQLHEVLKTPGDLRGNLHQLDIEIIEMSGCAGDVFLMDLRVLHTPSVNSTKNVRMMATTRFFFDGPSR